MTHIKWAEQKTVVELGRNPIVIHHSNCSDGVGAAWAFRHFFPKIELFSGVYNQPPPDCRDRTVYLVDFCYPRDVMMDIIEVAANVILLDHHKSALDAVYDLQVHPKFNMEWSTNERSGAVISWLYLTGQPLDGMTVPFFTLTVEDRDLWKFHYPNTRAIMTAFFAGELTVERYDEYVKAIDMVGPKADILRIGNTLMDAHANQVAGIIKSSKRRMHLAGYDVPLVNCNYMFASDVGQEIGKGELFAVTYHDSETDRQFSLRSAETGLDVSAIAKQYGGGGHKHAAGFKVGRDHVLAKI